MKKKYSRREFVKQNSMIGLGAAMPFSIHSSFLESVFKSEARPSYIDRIDNEIILHGRRNNQAWFEPSVGVIPGKGIKPPQVFVKATLLTGNDIGPQLYIKTDNLGKTWTNPILCQNWFKVPLDNHVWEEPWFGFIYHNRTDQFFAIGDTHFVQDAGTVTGSTLQMLQKTKHGFFPANGFRVCSLIQRKVTDSGQTAVLIIRVRL